MKNKIVATELAEERNKCNFNQEELYNLFFSNPEVRKITARADYDAENDPIMKNTHKYYEWTPEEIQ